MMQEPSSHPFYNAIRESIISLLVFVGLCFISHGIIKHLKKRKHCNPGEDDMVYGISLWLCCFTMSVSIGAVLLLPFSIISNEILLRYPHSYYIKWLNDALIHGLWNQIFLGTYIALFLAMPFAYFFTESEGFAGSTKGIKARLYETLVVLLLLGILLASLTWVMYGIWFRKTKNETESWLPHLPLVYSCISLFGVLLQLACTPLGFARLFSVLDQCVVKPQFLRDLDDEIKAINLQEESLQYRIRKKFGNGFSYIKNGNEIRQMEILRLLEERDNLEHQIKASAWERNLLYPLSLLGLVLLTAACMCMVGLNCLSLLFMNETLPLKTRYATLGKMSFSFLGSIGSMIEIVLIFYIMIASLVGFYGMPLFQHLRPRKRKTGMTLLIANCLVFLVLSSALPVLTRTIGITRFDLMGEFGKLDWLGNFHLVLFYNLVFEASTAVCLARKVTSTVCQTLFSNIPRSAAVFSEIFRSENYQ